ncbi:hypothetical protein GCM10027586_21050 [Kineococcus gypseus]|uniref:hypothetical protein n=1 Tax=Kineococcus gypseus TaxID=1637102 RepID=UPI003D7DF343
MSPNSDSPSGTSSHHAQPSPREDTVQQRLDAVAAQAAGAHHRANAEEWSRHQQHLHAHHRLRRRRRTAGLSIGLSLVAACTVAAAALSWSAVSGDRSSVRVLPAGPEQGVVSDADAQVHLSDPTAPGPLLGQDQSRSFEDLARDCAAQGGLGGRAGRGDGYRTVMTASSGLSQAVAVRDGDGRTWVCSYLPGSMTSGEVPTGDGGPSAVAQGAVAGGMGTAPDGSVLMSYFGYASPEVAAVTVTTAAGSTFPAIVTAGVWWATPRVPDDEAASGITWQATDADGAVIAASENTPTPAATGASAPEVAVTYQDGTNVTWPGPARGGAWATGAQFDEVPGELSTWDRQVREATFGGGWNEELGVHLGDDGQISYARSTGVFDSFVWAPGPQLSGLQLDPCSQWPTSPALKEPPAGQVCRVLSVQGHPVVAAEGAGIVTVFTVRADGVAVHLEERNADGEPVRSAEELAAASLTLPAP